MATTSGNLTAGTAAIGGSRQNGTGGRPGLRARVAAGVATLGCAAALAIGQLGAGDTGQAHSQLAPAAPVIQASAMSSYERWHFLEQNELPAGAPSVSVAPAAPNQDWAISDGTRPGFLAGAAGTLPPVESAEFRGNGYTER